jgi:hypothetical protein
MAQKCNPSFYFATQLTVHLADDDELMPLFLDAEFEQVVIGIETPQEDSLKSPRKNQNLKRNLLETIQKTSFKWMYYVRRIYDWF